jgi:hypothetical protein
MLVGKAIGASVAAPEAIAVGGGPPRSRARSRRRDGPGCEQRPSRYRRWVWDNLHGRKWLRADKIETAGAGMTVYRYHIALRAIVTCVAAALSAFPVIFLLAREFDLVSIMLTPVFVAGASFILHGALSRATIVVDDRHIAAYMFGIQTKAIRWQDIKKIRKQRVYNGYNYVDSFHVVDRRPRSLICKFFANVCGDIVVCHEISNLSGLLQQINSFARQYDIPLVVWDTEAAGAKLETKTGKEYWKEAVAKVEEVRVTQF